MSKIKETEISDDIKYGMTRKPDAIAYIEKNYPGKEKEMFESLSQSQPIGRMAKPQEVADLVLYLCSDEASFITGTDFPIDGGFIKLNGN